MAPPKGHAPYPGCETGGRPVKYTPEFLEELADDLDQWIDNVIKDGKFFWWKDWAIAKRILSQDIARFAKLSDKFYVTYKRALDLQESQVSKGAILKKCDSNFSKFYLQTQHRDNWTEKAPETIAISDLAALVKLINEGKLSQISETSQASAQLEAPSEPL